MNEIKKRPRGRPRKSYRKTSISLSPVGDQIWKTAAERLGLQQSPALEIILRDYARQNKIEILEVSDGAA